MPVRTICVASRSALHATKVALARSGNGNGIAVLPMEALATRLAGGFVRLPKDEEVLREIERILDEADPAVLGDIAEIAGLPGVRSTLAASLWKAWRGGLDLTAAAGGSSRLAAMARLEAEVSSAFDASVVLPAELVSRALSRLSYARALFGEVTVLRQADVDPCWRPLLRALPAHVRVVWDAGHHTIPAWLAGSGLGTETAPPAAPATETYSCANARHEVVEAMRWARRLMAEGVARPCDIAFAAAATSEFDEFVQAASEEASVPVHFAHGRAALETPDGQTAAALADILLRGLSQHRVRRLVSRLSRRGGTLEALPGGWASALPRGAPLDTLGRWAVALEPEELAEARALLTPLIADLAEGPRGAHACGRWLSDPARALWERALERAPADALERELRLLRMVDATEAEAAIAWMSADVLAASPRPFVWLLGLNSGTWPRLAAEDPFLPARVLEAAGEGGTSMLAEVSRTEADRRSFAAIMRGSRCRVARSFSRREATGRLLGESPLLDGAEAVHLQRTRIPEHAMSEPDRLMARPADFAAGAVAQSAALCWQNWNTAGVTAHDGRVSRHDHPALMAALAAPQSASSLTMMLRNPLGWMWRHALGMREAEEEAPSFELDGRQFGNFVHDMLDTAVLALTADGGSAIGDPARVRGTVQAAALAVAAQWEAQHALPPRPLWRERLAEAHRMATNAMLAPAEGMAGARSYSEVPFGRAVPDMVVPWDPSVRVAIPGTGLWLHGRIDRLDVLQSPPAARVLDFKTGRQKEGVVLQGGRELQRCLYAYAVHALLGADVRVDAALFYPSREDAPDHAQADAYGVADRLERPEETLACLTEAVTRAVAAVRAGLTIPGVAAGARWSETRSASGNGANEVDDLAFALPVIPGHCLDPKKLAARELLGAEFTAFWEEK